MQKRGNVSKSMEVTGSSSSIFGSVLLFFFILFNYGNKKLMMFSYGFIGQELDASVFMQLHILVL